MNTEIRSKICENCKYARQHYYISMGKFRKVPFAMHCANGKIAQKSFEKHYHDNSPCKHYEPSALQKQETEISIKKLLIRINNELDNVLQVIENVLSDE